MSKDSEPTAGSAPGAEKPGNWIESVQKEIATIAHEVEHDVSAVVKEVEHDVSAVVQEVEHDIDVITHEPPRVLFIKAVKLDLPYIVMISTAILSIGYISFAGQATPLLWEVLTPLFGAVCVWAGWRHADDHAAKVALCWTQALHWFGTLLAMYLVYTPDVRSVANNNASGLTLMTVLALSTFLAGVHVRAWQIGVVGALLALVVPMMAWIEQSSLFFIVALLGVVFVGGGLWWTTHAEKKKAAA
jgi:hypothetical protein